MTEPVHYFAGRDVRVRYWAAFTFLFSSPNGWKNLLILAVAMLVPIVGPVVIIGYLCEVLAPRPVDDGTGRLVDPPRPSGSYPDFEFPRLSAYLERGIWPVVASLVAGLAMVPVMFLVALPVIVVGAAGVGDALVAVAIALGVVLLVAAILLMSAAMVPLTLRAALLMEFGPTFSFAWVRDFVRRTWVELVLAWLFLIALGIPLSIAGYLMCFVGLYPAMALLTAAQWHLDFQLYHLYVSRGGAPVPVKPVRATPPPAPPPVPPSGSQ
jgi:hypothetical protein